MYNFGVREVPNAKNVPAPGWAYVADTVVNASVTANQPHSKRRARNLPKASNLHETTAKQDAKILSALMALDRDDHRQVSNLVPVRSRGNGGRVSHVQGTPAVRKILTSQKTFANYISDLDAFIKLNTGNGQPFDPFSQLSNTPTVGSMRRKSSSAASIQKTTPDKRPYRRRSIKDTSVAKSPLKIVTSASETPTSPTSITVKTESSNDVMMLDAPESAPPSNMPTSKFLAPPSSAPAPPHPGDNDPLLASKVPNVPTDEELQALLDAPPLTYIDVTETWTQEDSKKPIKMFCEVCGYWGRVRCMECGARVCALECLKTHQVDCSGGRYGA